MTVSMHPSTGKRGPKRKGLRAQIILPPEVYQAFEDMTTQVEGLHMTDLGAWYFLSGWNAEQERAGRPTVEIPTFAREAYERLEHDSEFQDRLVS